jgi:hypothetical protein
MMIAVKHYAAASSTDDAVPLWAADFDFSPDAAAADF